MKDLNFFESYIDKKKLQIDKQIIYYVTAGLLFLILVIHFVFNLVKIRRINKDIVRFKTIVEDEQINKKVEATKLRKEEVNEYTEFINRIKLLDKAVEKNRKIDDSLLESITSTIPENIFFTSINMYMDYVEIIGTSEDRESIAYLGENLESIEDFQEVFISSISKNEGYYIFILNINLEDVNFNGEDEAIEENETQGENSQE